MIPPECAESCKVGCEEDINFIIACFAGPCQPLKTSCAPCNPLLDPVVCREIIFEVVHPIISIAGMIAFRFAFSETVSCIFYQIPGASR
jgi:hypothetical protein